MNQAALNALPPNMRKIKSCDAAPLMAIDNAAAKQAYVYSMIFCGATKTDAATSEEGMRMTQNMVLNLISDNFSWCTTAHFKLAFEMNLLGELSAKYNHFGQFDCQFVADVLSDYGKWRSRVNLAYQHAVEALAPKLNGPSVEVTEADRKEILKQQIEQYKHKKDAWQMTAHWMFDWLWKKSYITNEFLSEDEWTKYAIEARTNIINRDKITKSRLETMSPMDRANFQSACDNEYKRIVYGIYLSQQK